VRVVATFWLVVCLCSAAAAQSQERALVDRLLRPDTTLQNPAQNKKFNPAGSQSIDKRATVATFYMEKKSKPRTFWGTRSFQSKQVDGNFFGDAKRKNGSADKKVRSSNYSGSSLQQPVHDAYDHDKAARTRVYADQRPFLDRGKSQKSLERHNQPLTIQQVRELLNKN